MGALIPIVVVVGVLGFGALWYFGSEQVARRAIRAATPRRIADWPEGQPTRLIGSIAGGEVLAAPLSGRACVYYRAVVEELRGNSKHRRWVSIIEEVRSVPFVVEDGSGRALVDPTGAQIACKVDRQTSSGTFDDATAVERSFLDRHKSASTGFLGFNRSLRYEEAILEVGERISVVGIGLREADPAAVGQVTGYRDGPPTKLRVGPCRDGKLYISDHSSETGL